MTLCFVEFPACEMINMHNASSSLSPFELIQRSQHGIYIGVENQWRTLLRCESASVFFLRAAGKQVATVEFQGELGVLQDVPCKNQNDRLIRPHESLQYQFLQACESDGGRRLAADAIRTDLGFR